MAVSLLDRFAVAADPTFLKRVAQALAEEAVAIYGEATPPANHPARAAFAVLVATDAPISMVTVNAQGIMAPDKRVFSVARLLTTLGIDNSDPSPAGDAAIKAGITQLWNALAGA